AAGVNIEPEFVSPGFVMIEGVDARRLVGAAVVFQIGLTVSREVCLRDSNRPRNRLLEKPGPPATVERVGGILLPVLRGQSYLNRDENGSTHKASLPGGRMRSGSRLLRPLQ